jgi:hypothetical protein
VTVIGRDIAIFQITTLLKESVFYCGGYWIWSDVKDVTKVTTAKISAVPIWFNI